MEKSGQHNNPGHFADEKNVLPLPGIEPGCPARSLVTILTTFYRLHVITKNIIVSRMVSDGRIVNNYVL
jgi:hypothetical protein